jgi:FAD/FMN-containing dehydrogenase
MATLSTLDAAIAGTVTRPGDRTWDHDRQAWNLAISQEPLAVVALADAADAVTTIRRAAAEGLAVTVQPRGHGATPGTADGAVLVRTSALQDLTIDTDRRVARVGAGVRWGDLNARLDGTGLIGLAGTNPSVSVLGSLLGGGLSWFGRNHGVAATSVRSIELVTPAGQQVRVSPDVDPELFWALRGAGGEFGIVTAAEIELFPHPSIVGGQLVFPVDAAAGVLAAFIELTATAPTELTAFANVVHFPPLPCIPEPVRGKSVVSLAVAYLGDEDGLATRLGPMRAAGPLIQDTVAPLPVSQLGQIAEEPVDPFPAVQRSFLLRRFDDATAGRFLGAVGSRESTPLMSITIRHLDGACATGRPEGGIAANVDEPFLVGATAPVFDPATVPASRAGFAALGAALGGDAVDRAPFNFLGDRPITAAYSAADIARLRAIKRTHDPDHVIRSNRPIPT